MDKILNVMVYEQYDRFLDTVDHQEINEDLPNGGHLDFSVFNLLDCPEDAIIERDLFNARDYIDALNKGIELAKLGYDKVKGKFINTDEIDGE